MSMIRNVEEYEEEIEGITDFSLLGSEIGVFINEGATIEYAEKCVEHLNSLSDAIIEKLCEFSIRYCESMRKYFGEMDVFIPENIKLREILKYIYPGELIIEEPVDDRIAYHLELNCDWEEEHGLEWVIREDEVLYVGSFNSENPFFSKDYFKNASWNYAEVG